jgi:hypothetical protein
MPNPLPSSNAILELPYAPTQRWDDHGSKMGVFEHNGFERADRRE